MYTFTSQPDNLISETSRVDKPSTLELVVALIPGAAFYLLVLVKSISSPFLIAGTLLFIGVMALAERERGSPPFAFEVFAVAMGSAAILFAIWMFFGTSPEWEWVAIMAASLTAQSLYATYRIPKGRPSRRGSLLENAIGGLKWGIGLSVVFTIMVVLFRGPVIAIVMLTADQPSEAQGMVWVPVAYVSSGAAAGLLIGLLRGAARWPAGRVFLGLLGGMVTYAVIGALMPLIDPNEEALKIVEIAAIAFAAGTLVGPATAFYWADPITPETTLVERPAARTNRPRYGR